MQTYLCDSAAGEVEVSGVSVLSDGLGFEGLHSGAGVLEKPSNPVASDRIVHVDDVFRTPIQPRGDL